MLKVEAYDKDNDKYLLLDKGIETFERAAEIAKRFVDYLMQGLLKVDNEPADWIVISDQETEKAIAYTNEYQVVMY